MSPTHRCVVLLYYIFYSHHKHKKIQRFWWVASAKVIKNHIATCCSFRIIPKYWVETTWDAYLQWRKLCTFGSLSAPQITHYRLVRLRTKDEYEKSWIHFCYLSCSSNLITCYYIFYQSNYKQIIQIVGWIAPLLPYWYILSTFKKWKKSF